MFKERPFHMRFFFFLDNSQTLALLENISNSVLFDYAFFFLPTNDLFHQNLLISEEIIKRSLRK